MLSSRLHHVPALFFCSRRVQFCICHESCSRYDCTNFIYLFFRQTAAAAAWWTSFLDASLCFVLYPSARLSCFRLSLLQAMPMDNNILEWHYVITGTKGSPYEGGHYHGKLKFPPEVRQWIHTNVGFGSHNRDMNRGFPCAQCNKYRFSKHPMKRQRYRQHGSGTSTERKPIIQLGRDL